MTWQTLVRVPPLLCAIVQIALAGGLHELWRVDLGQEIRGPADRTQMQPGVLALRFSPDGKKIAVAGNAFQYRPGQSRLIVVQADHPKQAVQSFDIADIATDSLGEPAAYHPSVADLLASTLL